MACTELRVLGVYFTLVRCVAWQLLRRPSAATRMTEAAVFVPLRLMGRLRESVKVGLASMRKYLSLSGQKPDLEKCINMELVT